MNNNLVVVKEYRFWYEAELAKGRLDASSIISVLQKSNAAVFGEFTSTFGGAELLVKEKDYNKAKEILDE